MAQILNKFGFLLNYLPANFVFGRTYSAARKINEEYNQTRDKLGFAMDYQSKMISHILNHSREKSRFYRDYSMDLEKNDFIDKDAVLLNFPDMLISSVGADYITTGGTSGKTLGFYINRNRKGAEWFYMTSHWHRVGFSSSSYRAVLRNHVINDSDFYIHNSFLREFQFSNYNLTVEKLERIVNKLKQLKPEFIHAYPSAAYLLCKFLKDNQIELPFLKAFLSGSENIYDFQRELIQDTLGYRLFSWYGHSEKLILAAECEHTSNYHANPFYGFMELVDEEGYRVSKPGAIGEIVGTGFINTAMPFIRYRTGDFAEYVGESCPSCGRIGLVFKNVKGRWSGEMVYSRTKTPVSTTALNMHNELYDNIKGLQFYQSQFGRVVVRVVPEQTFRKDDEKKIISELELKLGSEFEVSIQTVQHLEYTKNNKFKLLIQEINKSELDNL